MWGSQIIILSLADMIVLPLCMWDSWKNNVTVNKKNKCMQKLDWKSKWRLSFCETCEQCTGKVVNQPNSHPIDGELRLVSTINNSTRLGV